MAAKLPLSRREFVKGTGGLLIGFESLDKIPYRRLVNAIGRVASAARVTSS